MKGLNNMDNKIGRFVKIKEHPRTALVGTIGVIRARCNNDYIVELPKSVIENSVGCFDGIEINGVCIWGDRLEFLGYDDFPVEKSNDFIIQLQNQEANEKRNMWEVRIRSYEHEKDITDIELYINGRLQRIEYVGRYHEDEYSASTACIEACKKLFGVKDEEKKDEEGSAPKYYTGKVVCIEKNPWFTQGKVYEVKNGNVIDDQGSIYSFIEGVNDMCAQIKVEFIEFVE